MSTLAACACSALPAHALQSRAQKGGSKRRLAYEDNVLFGEGHEFGHDIIPQLQIEDAKGLEMYFSAALEPEHANVLLQNWRLRVPDQVLPLKGDRRLIGARLLPWLHSTSHVRAYMHACRNWLSAAAARALRAAAISW